MYDSRALKKLEKITRLNSLAIGYVPVTVKGLEAYLEAAFQIQLQLHVFYHGFEFGK